MKIGIAKERANLRETRLHAAKVFAQLQTGKRILDYKHNPADAAKVGKLSSEVNLHKVELQGLRKEGTKLYAAETGLMALERRMVGLHGLFAKVCGDPDMKDEELEQINKEKKDLLEDIDSVVQNTTFGRNRC